MRITVHNADGVNPYGTEIAALLHERGHAVTLVDAANGEHRPPPGVAWRRLLPANFGPRTRAQQVRRLVRGLTATAWASAVRGEVVLVSSVQLPAENVVLAALGAAGRPVVHVQHDPVRRRAESSVSRWSRRQILLRSTVAVVHADRLKDEVDPAAADHVLVCPHPPYTVSGTPVASAVPQLSPDRRWLAFLGTLRSDKGIDLVPEILERVPASERSRFGLVVCGRGALPAEAWQRLHDLGMPVVDLTSQEPVPHETLLAVLTQQPLLLAPYVAATQSGSVILALTLGCRVLAFDKGGIPDVVTPEGLVPNGDVQAFADALTEGRSGTSRAQVGQWAATAADAWSAAVGEAVARARRPHRRALH